MLCRGDRRKEGGKPKVDDWRKGKDATVRAPKAQGRGMYSDDYPAAREGEGRRGDPAPVNDDPWGCGGGMAEPTNLEEFEKFRVQARQHWDKPKVRPLAPDRLPCAPRTGRLPVAEWSRGRSRTPKLLWSGAGK